MFNKMVSKLGQGREEVAMSEYNLDNNNTIKGDVTMLNNNRGMEEIMMGNNEEMVNEIVGKINDGFTLSLNDLIKLELEKRAGEEVELVDYAELNEEEGIIFDTLNKREKIRFLLERGLLTDDVDTSVTVEDYYYNMMTTEDLNKLIRVRVRRENTSSLIAKFTKAKYTSKYSYVTATIDKTEDGDRVLVYHINDQYKNKLFVFEEDKFMDELELSNTIVLTENGLTKVNNFTDKIVNVRYEDNSKFYGNVWYNKQEGLRVTYETGMTKANGWMKLLPFSYTASEEKKNIITYLEEENYEVIANAFSNGAYSQNVKDSKEFSYKGIAKAIVRLKQGAPVMTNNGELKNFAIVLDKVDSHDGLSMVSSRIAAKVLSEFIGETVREKNVEGLQLQARPGTCKVSSIVLKNESMKVITDKYEAVEYTGGDIYSYIEDNKGKVLIVGDGENLDFITDLNGIKANANPEEFGWRLNIMDFRAGQNSARLSKQHVLKYPKTVQKEIARLAQKQIFDDYVNIGLVKNRFNLDELKYISGVIQNVIPEMRGFNYHFKKDLLKNELKSTVKKINKFSYDLDGAHLTLIPDLSKVFGLKEDILLGDEIYTTNYIFSKSKGIDTMRFPGVSKKEYGVYRTVTFMEIKERILDRVREGELTKEQYEALIRAIKTLKTGSMMVPSNDDFKNNHGGADFDFDSMIVVRRNSEINFVRIFDTVNIVSDEEYEKVSEMKLPKEGLDVTELNLEIEEETYTIENISKFLAEKISQGGMSVGEFTNLAERINAILEAGVENAREILAKNFEVFRKDSRNLSSKYVGLFKETVVKDFFLKTYVSIEAVDVVLKEMTYLDFYRISEEDLNKVFNDLEAIGRLYQESIIDSSKTGEIIEVPKEYVELGGLIELDYQKELAMSIDHRENLVMIEDRMYNPKKFTIKTIMGETQNLLAKMVKTIIDRALANKVLSEYRLQDGKSELNQLRSLYFESNREFISKLKDVEENQYMSFDVKEERYQDIQEEYVERKKALASMFRFIMKDLTLEERVTAVMDRSSCRSNKGLITSGLYQLLEEEVLLYELIRNNKRSIVIEEAFEGDKVGVKVEMEGIEFKVTESNGKLYRVSLLYKAIESIVEAKELDKVVIKLSKPNRNDNSKRQLPINVDLLKETAINNDTVELINNNLSVRGNSIGAYAGFSQLSSLNAKYVIESVQETVGDEYFVVLRRTGVLTNTKEILTTGTSFDCFDEYKVDLNVFVEYIAKDTVVTKYGNGVIDFDDKNVNAVRFYENKDMIIELTNKQTITHYINSIDDLRYATQLIKGAINIGKTDDEEIIVDSGEYEVKLEIESDDQSIIENVTENNDILDNKKFNKTIELEYEEDVEDDSDNNGYEVELDFVSNTVVEEETEEIETEVNEVNYGVEFSFNGVDELLDEETDLDSQIELFKQMMANGSLQ